MGPVLGLVTFRIFPTYMGGQKGVALFYRYLKAHLPVLLALSNDNQPTEEFDVAPLLHPNRRIYRNFGAIAPLRQLVRARDVSMIMAEHSYSGWIAWLLRKPFILHSHNIEGQRFRRMHKPWWRLYHLYEGWIHRKAKHSFFISGEDRDYAIRHFRLRTDACSVITYGVEAPKMLADRLTLQNQLCLPADKAILLFNGTLDYTPNLKAVEVLVDTLAPLLRDAGFPFHIVVTGNRAPRDLIGKMLSCPELTYAGYVPDVNAYYQAADLFINPVANDTGVKTKLIEALANHSTAVSAESGASGIPRDLCGDKLHTVRDGDWDAFAAAIRRAVEQPASDTPAAFFDHYLWTHIAARAAQTIKTLTRT